MKKKGLTFLYCLFLVLCFIACSELRSFEEITDDEESGIKVESFSSSEMRYTISLFENLTRTSTSYSDFSKIDEFIDTLEILAEVILIEKYNSSVTVLEDEWNRLNMIRHFTDKKLVHSGLTNYLSIPSYCSYTS